MTTTSTESALLRAIAAHPEEDTPRLMYADLIDDDQPERAEFIRLQIALAGPDDQLPRCEACEGRGEIDYFRGPGATNPASKDCPVCGGGSTARKAIIDRVSALWHSGVSRQFANGKNRVALAKPPREYTDRDPVLLIARGFAETLYLPTLADLCERDLSRQCTICGGRGEVHDGDWAQCATCFGQGRVPGDYTGKPTKLALDIMRAHPTITRVVCGDSEPHKVGGTWILHNLRAGLVPAFLIEQMDGRSFDSRPAALDALAVAAGQWLRLHTQGESQ